MVLLMVQKRFRMTLKDVVERIAPALDYDEKTLKLKVKYLLDAGS